MGDTEPLPAAGRGGLPETCPVEHARVRRYRREDLRFDLRRGQYVFFASRRCRLEVGFGSTSTGCSTSRATSCGSTTTPSASAGGAVSGVSAERDATNRDKKRFSSGCTITSFFPHGLGRTGESGTTSTCVRTHGRGSGRQCLLDPETLFRSRLTSTDGRRVRLRRTLGRRAQGCAEAEPADAQSERAQLGQHGFSRLVWLGNGLCCCV